MMYVRFPLSLRQVEDLLHERGVDISHETVRAWWNRFGPRFAAEIRRRRVYHRSYSRWRWHMDEMFVRINGETHYLWLAIDHEGEVLEVFATKRRDRKSALRFPKRTMKRYGRPKEIVTDRLRSYGAAIKVIGNSERQECGRWLNNRAENSHQPFRRRESAMAKFRDVKTLQKFASLHASIHNHFYLDHHLNRRKPSKKTAPPLWSNGASWRPEFTLIGNSQTALHYTDTTPQPSSGGRSARLPATVFGPHRRVIATLSGAISSSARSAEPTSIQSSNVIVRSLSRD